MAAKKSSKPKPTELIVRLFLPEGMKPKHGVEFLREAISNHLIELTEEGAPAERVPSSTFMVKAAPVAKPASA